MQAGMKGGFALRIWWATVLSSEGSGGRKRPLFLSGGSRSSLVSTQRCVFKSAEKQSPNSCRWSKSECRPHPIPHPTSHASTSLASLPHSDGFLEQLLAYSHLPTSPRFPFLSMILYWDFYNYLCLLHPSQYQVLCCGYPQRYVCTVWQLYSKESVPSQTVDGGSSPFHVELLRLPNCMQRLDFLWTF